MCIVSYVEIGSNALMGDIKSHPVHLVRLFNLGAPKICDLFSFLFLKANFSQ